MKKPTHENAPATDRQIHELFIRVSPEKLWQALTDGALTSHYFFGTVVKSSFKPGTTLEYLAPDGAPVVTGTVLDCEPGKRLAHTWKVQYDPSCSDEVSNVCWLIVPRGSACKLTVIHDFSSAPKTAAHLAEGKDGWNVVLSGLKTYLETGVPLELPMSA
jgi:uncharacterized protein YndB with AHSA1/START domain